MKNARFLAKNRKKRVFFGEDDWTRRLGAAHGKQWVSTVLSAVEPAGQRIAYSNACLSNGVRVSPFSVTVRACICAHSSRSQNSRLLLILKNSHSSLESNSISPKKKPLWAV